MMNPSYVNAPAPCKPVIRASDEVSVGGILGAAAGMAGGPILGKVAGAVLRGAAGAISKGLGAAGRAIQKAAARASKEADKSSSKALTNYYPANSGALGKWSREFLMPGTKIDRFGSKFGRYLSPYGTPLNMRALPPGNTGAYSAYKVLKPFEVQSSTIAPAFGKIGLGKQYLSPVKVNILLKKGIITPIK